MIFERKKPCLPVSSPSQTTLCEHNIILQTFMRNKNVVILSSEVLKHELCLSELCYFFCQNR